MIILWNALWENQTGVIFTYTVPILRVMLRVLLTNGTEGSFGEVNILKFGEVSTSDNETSDTSDNDTNDTSDNETSDNDTSDTETNHNDSTSGNEDVWVIRRKPSNPDAIKKSNKSFWGFVFGF